MTEQEREILECLAEEAAEVIQAVTKILRHGLYSFYPQTGESNTSALWNELNDFAVIWDRIVELGIVDEVSDNLDEIWDRKRQWLHYST